MPSASFPPASPSVSPSPLQRQLLTAAVALAVASSASVYAAEPDTEEHVELPTLTVQAKSVDDIKVDEASSPKLTQPLLDTPRSITVVPEDVMKQQGATSLGDVMRNVSGITMAAGEGGTPAGDNLNIRGFSARTDLFIDGMRDFGGYSRDPFNLEAVEVIKGPSSAYSGRGGTGGSVNQVSKTARLEDFTEASLSLGTDELRRVTADINQTIGDNSALRLNLLGHDAQTPGRDDVVENSRWGLAPTITFGLETDTRITLSYFHLTQNNMPDYGLPYDQGDANGIRRPIDVDYDNFYGLANRDFEDINTDIGTLGFEHDFNESVSLRNQFRYAVTQRESLVTAPRLQAPYTLITREGKHRNSRDTILANQTDATFRFNTGGIRHALVSGMELSRETSDNHPNRYENVVNGDIQDPNPYDPYTGAITPNNHTQTRSVTEALYVFDTLEFNRYWQLNLGVRYDHFDTDYSSRAPDDTLTERSQADDTLNYQAGVVFKPLENGSIYVSYGTSSNPSAEGLSLSETTVNLDPEQTESYELGTKWDLLDERLGLAAAIFRINKDNARTNNGSRGDVYVLEGQQQVDGFEISLNGHITDRWEMIATYTYLDGEIKQSKNPDEVGKQVAKLAPNSYSLWSTYDILSNLTVGGGLQYLDEQYGNSTNTTLIDDYLLYDAMANYAVNDRFSLQLNLNNITDEDYISKVGGGHAVPGEGRSAVLTANVRL